MDTQNLDILERFGPADDRVCPGRRPISHDPLGVWALHPAQKLRAKGLHMDCSVDQLVFIGEQPDLMGTVAGGCSS